MEQICLAISLAAADYESPMVVATLMGMETYIDGGDHGTFMAIYTNPGYSQASDAPVHLLSAAAYLGDLSLVSGLLHSLPDMDVNTLSDIFGKPLLNAARMGHRDVVRLLLQRGADGKYRGYPLTEDYRHGLEIWYSCKWTGECHVGCEGRIVCTALEAAALGGHEDVVELVLQEQRLSPPFVLYYFTAVTYAAMSGNVKVLEMLVNAVTNPDNFPWHYLQKLWDYSLICAACHGKTETIPFLLRLGAQIDAEICFKQSYTTALGYAASRGYHDTVRLLLQNGAAVDGGHVSGDIPVFLAARYGFSRTMELLLNVGAGVDPEPSLLQEAVRFGQVDCVEVLLRRGWHERNNGGAKALQIAKSMGWQLMVELLREHGVQDS